MDRCNSIEKLNSCSKRSRQDSGEFVVYKHYYSIGWNKRSYLLEGDESIIYEFQLTNRMFVKLEIKKDENDIKVFKKDGKESNWVNIEESEFSWELVDLNNKGDRWEGVCRNGAPFGYGCLFNEDNHVVYKGYMVYDEKVCFGEEYYNNGIIEYQGTYMNGYRHGYGCLYDMNGKMIYEGKWAFGQNDNFDVVIPNDYADDDSIHNLVCDLIVGNKCYRELNELKIINYPNLRVFRVGLRSFEHVKLVKLTDCEKLEILAIGDVSMINTQSLIFDSFSN